MRLPGGEPERAQRRDLDRRRRRWTSVRPQPKCVRVSPTPDAAVGTERARMSRAAHDVDGIVDLRDANGDVRIGARAVAELPEAVGAPAPHAAVVLDGAAEPPAARDRLERLLEDRERIGDHVGTRRLPDLAQVVQAETLDA